MIISHLDADYIDFAKVFLYSIAKNAPQEKVGLSTINLSSKQMLDLFDNFPFNSKIYDIKNHKLEFQDQDKQHLLQNRVTKVIVEALESLRDSIYIVTNIDMIVRKPLDFLYEEMQDYDIGVCINSTHPGRNPPQILSGFLVFNTKNSKVLDFALDYDKAVHKKGKECNYDGQLTTLDDTFHLDQEVLFSLCIKHRHDFKFWNLDYYKFFAGVQDGVVWSAERTQKQKTLEAFKREVGYQC